MTCDVDLYPIRIRFDWRIWFARAAAQNVPEKDFRFTSSPDLLSFDGSAHTRKV